MEMSSYEFIGKCFVSVLFMIAGAYTLRGIAIIINKIKL